MPHPFLSAISLYLCVTGAFSKASPPHFNCEPSSLHLQHTATDLRHLFCSCSWLGPALHLFLLICCFFFLATTIIFINSQSQKSPAWHQKEVELRVAGKRNRGEKDTACCGFGVLGLGLLTISKISFLFSIIPARVFHCLRFGVAAFE